MPQSARFVLLLHTTPAGYARATHYDFMIEVAGALRTWALEQTPHDGLEINAEQLADHRVAYLELEGEISGGRGTVTRVDCGTYSVTRETEDELLLEVRGAQLVGQALLARQASNEISREADSTDSGESQRWKFKFTSVRPAMGSPAG